MLDFKGVLAPRPGLEPGTYGLTVRRSTNWAIEEYIRFFKQESCLRGVTCKGLVPHKFLKKHCSKKFSTHWVSWILNTKSHKKNQSSMTERAVLLLSDQNFPNYFQLFFRLCSQRFHRQKNWSVHARVAWCFQPG